MDEFDHTSHSTRPFYTPRRFAMLCIKRPVNSNVIPLEIIMSHLSTVSNWIPAITALAGALIGFGASFGTAYFNQITSANESKEQRKRKKLENLYEVLIDIKSDYQGMTASYINKVHFNKDIEPKNYEGIAPLIYLDMLINLYMPEMKSIYKDLVIAKDAVGTMYAGSLVDDFTSKTHEEKKKICGDFFELTDKVLKTVEVIQREIANTIKV